MVSVSDARFNEAFNEILTILKQVQKDHSKLSAAVDAIGARVELLSFNDDTRHSVAEVAVKETTQQYQGSTTINPTKLTGDCPSSKCPDPSNLVKSTISPDSKRKSPATSRIILTTYPGQSGIDPIAIDWGNNDPIRRGPVVVSRNQNTVRRRNGQFDYRVISNCTD
jgi:hypothetical protein